MKMKLYRLLAIFTIASMVLTACATAATPPSAVQPAPVAPEPAPEGTPVMEDIQINDGSGWKPFDPSNMDIQTHPEPQEVLEIIELPGDATETIQDLNSVMAGQVGGKVNSGAVMSVLAVALQEMMPAPQSRGSCTAQSLATAKQIIAHTVDPYRNMDPNIKWAGSVFSTLERMLPALASGDLTNFVIQGFVQSGDGQQLAIWFKWFDPVKGAWRNIMLVLGQGARTIIGSVYPMGEPAVIVKYGSLKEAVSKKFKEIVEWTAEGVINRDAKAYMTRDAVSFLGNALGFTVYMYLENSQMVDFTRKYLAYWAGCLNEALKENPRYKDWKTRQPDTKKEMALLANEAGVVVFASEEEARAAGNAVLVVGGIVVLVKIAGLLTQQYWVVLVPVP